MKSIVLTGGAASRPEEADQKSAPAIPGSVLTPPSFERGQLGLDSLPRRRIGLVRLWRGEEGERFLLVDNCLRDFAVLKIGLRQRIQTVAIGGPGLGDRFLGVSQGGAPLAEIA